MGRSDALRNLLNQISASLALAGRVTGFFATWPVLPWLQPGGTIEANSFYDTADLKCTLELLVDFDRLNSALARSTSAPATSSISTRQRTASGSSMSWPARNSSVSFERHCGLF